jgi:CHAT domain-containing protein
MRDLERDEVKDTMQFLIETLQLVADSCGDSKQIYPIWKNQYKYFNEELLGLMQQLPKNFLEENADQRIYIALTLNEFGNLIQQFPLGLRWLNIELSITAFKLALEIFKQELFPEQWAMVQSNLAASYSLRIRGEKSENIEGAIAFYQAALSIYTRETYEKNWATVQINLAATYLYRIGGQRSDNLEESIIACESALQVYTRNTSPESWATVQINIAAAYTYRIQGDKAENLEIAINAYELALQIYSYDMFPEDWAMVHNNLSSTYTSRILGNRADNLEKAIDSCKLALTVRTRDALPTNWAKTQNNLAIAYSERIFGDHDENLEIAISAYKSALQIYTREAFPKDWAMVQNGLAISYDKRIRGSRSDNLEKAISSYKLALQVYTYRSFPENWAGVQNNLATTYKNRIQGDRSDNLDKAIAAYELALKIYSLDAFPEDWAMIQNNLANTYKNRIRGDRSDNLEKAIGAYKSALAIRTRDNFPESWAKTQHNLANAYSERFLGSRAENLEQSIAAYKIALAVRTREAFPKDWAMTQNNLAAAYSERIYGDRADNIEEAIAIYYLTLQVYTHATFPEQWAMTQNNLATAYTERIWGDRFDNISKAIIAFEWALQVRTHEVFPEKCRQTCRNLGNLQFSQYNWSTAMIAYDKALVAAQILYQDCIFLDSKAAELAEISELYRRAAYVLVQLGNLEKSIETLEQFRARGLSESLDRDRANLTQLQQLAPNLYTHYQDITNQLRNLESQQRDRMVSDDRHSLTPEILRTTATKLRTDLEETIAQIRQVPGYETFLTPTQWEDIQSTLTPDNPLIYFITTTHGSLALIATSDHIEALWPELTEPELTELLNTYLAAYKQSTDNRQTWLDTIDSTTQNLWDSFMAPIVHHLETHGYNRATLVPTGTLSLLPLHAAWTLDENKPTGRRYALDTIHFTYTPNAKSLTVARSIANQVHTDSILAIDNPTQDLDLSKQEVQAAIATFPQFTVLSQKEATVEAVRLNLGKAAIVHFSCHGTANFQEPLNSGLALSDGLLTLRDLFALNLPDQNGLRLAVLSACETGLPGLENIDEVVSLPIGLLQAGVAGVVSSLWSVDEVSTMMLLTRFYELWRKDGLEPAIALHQAQQWMANTTDGEKARYYGGFTTTPDGYTDAHPFHWAAFSYLGV